MLYQDADGRIRGCGVGEDGMLPQQVRGGETCKMPRVAERHFSVTERMRTVREICKKRGIVLKRGRRE